MRYATVDEWLAWQASLHPKNIDLGLDRCREVLSRLGMTSQFSIPVITVAGTNGKGSSVALLESILTAAGYRVGAYTSPHLLRYNERIRLRGEPVGDEALCEAFERVDQARGELSLTYFEFGTLAALDLFSRARLDVVVLEVGLGGRLDAVNLIDADVALVTSVDLDHQDWLGDDLEAIAREKAGILRPGRPAVFGGEEPPEALRLVAEELRAPLYIQGQDYGVRSMERGWSWWCEARQRTPLPPPALKGGCQQRNAAAVLMVLELLEGLVPVDQSAVRCGLQDVKVSGRFQIIPGDPELILDVSHNPAAAQVLAANLRARTTSGRNHLLFGMLADKDVAGVVRALAPEVDSWTLVTPQDARALPAEDLARLLGEEGVSPVQVESSMSDALVRVRALAEPGDRILITGSFITVAQAMSELGVRA